MIWLPAAIGVGGALITLLLRDLLLPLLRIKSEKRRGEQEIYEEYLRPILLALESFMWRLDEILNQPGRGSYLLTEAGGSFYAQYKQISTVYRASVLIAWFRAFDKEMLNLRVVDLAGDDVLRSAMGRFQGALADGKSIEIEKLERLCSLWDVGGKTEAEDREITALKIENIMERRLGENKGKGVAALPAAAGREIVLEIMEEMQASLGVQIDAENVYSCVDDAVSILSIRQTWIYRDWQSSIGDQMLRSVSSGPRKYEVIGFGEFEELWLRNKPLWLERVSSLFLDFDPALDDGNDARRMQLQKLLRTTAEMIVVLLDKDHRLTKAMKATSEKARYLTAQ